MKELEKHESEKIEIHAVKPIQNQQVLTASLRPKPGQKVWQLDLSTGLITEAEYKNDRVELITTESLITGEGVSSTKRIKDIDCKPNCIYWPAINVENANKHFHRLLNVKYKKPDKKK